MKKLRMVALGDSITYGYPYTPAESWVEQLRIYSDWEILNRGISGDTLEDMNLRLKKDVLDEKPDYTIVMGGTNDVFQDRSQPQLINSLLSILNTLKQNRIKYFIGIPLPVEDFTEGALSLWRNWLKEYCRENKIPFIDFHQDFLNDEGQIRAELFLDGCHPRIKGYEVMGKRAIKTFQELDYMK
jgi:lysophospholipase L1-like esterase